VSSLYPFPVITKKQIPPQSGSLVKRLLMEILPWVRPAAWIMDVACAIVSARVARSVWRPELRTIGVGGPTLEGSRGEDAPANGFLPSGLPLERCDLWNEETCSTDRRGKNYILSHDYHETQFSLTNKLVILVIIKFRGYDKCNGLMRLNSASQINF
jgi:hypothetical protein